MQSRKLLTEKSDFTDEVQNRRHKVYRGDHQNTVHGNVDIDVVQRRVYKDLVTDIANTGPCVSLVKDGKWCVPPEQRPKGWEKMGVREN